MKRLLLLLLGNIILATSSRAAVTLNDALIASPAEEPAYLGSFPSGRYFFLTQTAPPGNGMFLYNVTSPVTNSFTLTYAGIAEANSLFLVDPGMEFDIDFINSQSPFVNNSNNPGSGTFNLLPGDSRYLAYWDDRFFTDNDLFGWARVSNIGGNLVVESSATAVGGGIVVGTAQQIPEPSAVLLLVISGSVGLIRRGRPSHCFPAQTGAH